MGLCCNQLKSDHSGGHAGAASSDVIATTVPTQLSKKRRCSEVVDGSLVAASSGCKGGNGPGNGPGRVSSSGSTCGLSREERKAKVSCMFYMFTCFHFSDSETTDVFVYAPCLDLLCMGLHIFLRLQPPFQNHLCLTKSAYYCWLLICCCCSACRQYGTYSSARRRLPDAPLHLQLRYSSHDVPTLLQPINGSEPTQNDHSCFF